MQSVSGKVKRLWRLRPLLSYKQQKKHSFLIMVQHRASAVDSFGLLQIASPSKTS